MLPMSRVERGADARRALALRLGCPSSLTPLLSVVPLGSQGRRRQRPDGRERDLRRPPVVDRVRVHFSEPARLDLLHQTIQAAVAADTSGRACGPRQIERVLFQQRSVERLGADDQLQ